MAGLPSWRDQIPKSYTGAKKWGTGINPIHSQRGGYEGRNNTGPANYSPVPTGLTSLEFGYVTEDIGVDTSWMDAHPDLGQHFHRARANYPSWGDGPSATPQGTRKRILKEGTNPKEGHTDQEPKGQAGEGWENKRTSNILDSMDSDPEQYIITTSHKQRDAVRNNNAAITRGTDAPREVIASRIPGMRMKVYSGGIRHEEMTPKTQGYRPRPFLFRSAGTGPRHWMLANEENPSYPIQRQIPSDVNMGPSEDNVDTGEIDTAWW